MVAIPVAELAAALNVTDSCISRYRSRGMPTTSIKAAVAWVATHVSPQYGRNADRGASRARALRDGRAGKPPAGGMLDPVQEKARRDREAGTKIALQNARTLAGTCEIAAVEATIAPFLAAIHREFAGFGATLAPLVAPLRDPARIKETIDDEAARLLTRLAGLAIGEPVRRRAR